ncbi:R3H domain-containing protein 1 [Labeo rohita]|uniref:R3H domain-containing protein 1 n=1 Tax=Labeo rohita TaxID=84645 RepID=A0ABQ8LCN4_LABRO|nr:R3H domain-containing protein 1 [Labeo rohita]
MRMSDSVSETMRSLDENASTADAPESRTHEEHCSDDRNETQVMTSRQRQSSPFSVSVQSLKNNNSKPYMKRDDKTHMESPPAGRSERCIVAVLHVLIAVVGSVLQKRLCLCLCEEQGSAKQISAAIVLPWEPQPSAANQSCVIVLRGAADVDATLGCRRLRRCVSIRQIPLFLSDTVTFPPSSLSFHFTCGLSRLRRRRERMSNASGGIPRAAARSFTTICQFPARRMCALQTDATLPASTVIEDPWPRARFGPSGEYGKPLVCPGGTFEDGDTLFVLVSNEGRWRLHFSNIPAVELRSKTQFCLVKKKRRFSRVMFNDLLQDEQMFFLAELSVVCDSETLTAVSLTCFVFSHCSPYSGTHPERPLKDPRYGGMSSSDASVFTVTSGSRTHLFGICSIERFVIREPCLCLHGVFQFHRCVQGLVLSCARARVLVKSVTLCNFTHALLQSNAKVKLVRSLAVCEDPCPSTITTQLPQDQQDGDHIKLSQTFDKEESPLTANEDDKSANKLEKMPRKMLSRDSSQEYKDSTGIDLHGFLVNTLKNNPRVAAYFGLDHNVDQSGKCVIVNKTSNTRIPDQKFSEHIRDDKTDDFQKRYILKRDNSSIDKDDSVMRMKLKEDRRSKSIEEREEEYQRARDRIFADTERRPVGEQPPKQLRERGQVFGAAAVEQHRFGQLQPQPEARHDQSQQLQRDPGSDPRRQFQQRQERGTALKDSSVGSSTGSLARSQPPPAAAALTQPVAFPAVSASGGVSYEPPASTASASYYLLPLDAAGIPAGSILVNPHTGQPFLNPDGSAVVYNPSVASQAPRCQSSVAPPPAAHPQHQPTNHVMPQVSLVAVMSLRRSVASLVCPAVVRSARPALAAVLPADPHSVSQPAAHCGTYSSFSTSCFSLITSCLVALPFIRLCCVSAEDLCAVPCASHFNSRVFLSFMTPSSFALHRCQSHNPLTLQSLKALISAYTCSADEDNLSAQFSHMMLVQPGSGDGRDAHAAVYPLQTPAPPPHQTGYVMPSPGQTVANPAFPAPPAVSQQPQQSFIQQQMPSCYCSPSQYPVSGQPYRPVGSVPYSAQSQMPPAHAQQTGKSLHTRHTRRRSMSCVRRQMFDWIELKKVFVKPGRVRFGGADGNGTNACVLVVGAAECGAEALSETPYDSHSEPVSFPAPHSSSITRLCRIRLRVTRRRVFAVSSPRAVRFLCPTSALIWAKLIAVPLAESQQKLKTARSALRTPPAGQRLLRGEAFDSAPPITLTATQMIPLVTGRFLHLFVRSHADVTWQASCKLLSFGERVRWDNERQFNAAGYQTVMPNQQQNYQNIMQPPPNQTLVSGQHSNMGNQMQGMMVQYPSVPSYQVSVPQQTYQQPVISHAPVPASSIQVYYSIIPPNQQNHTDLIFCYKLKMRAVSSWCETALSVQVKQRLTDGRTAPRSCVTRLVSLLKRQSRSGAVNTDDPHLYRSELTSSVGFLPPPGAEQMPFHRTSPPCGSQQIPAQQCSGTAARRHPYGSSSVLSALLSDCDVPELCSSDIRMMGNSASSCLRKGRLENTSGSGSAYRFVAVTFGLVPFPARHKGAPPPSAGGMVMMHLALPASQQPQSHSPQQWKHNKYYSSDHMRSQKPSDVCALERSRSPAPTHLTSVKNIRPSLNSVPIMPHFSRSFVSGQGDVRYPLLGPTLQYNPQIRPPLLQAPPMVSSQAPVGIRPAVSVRVSCSDGSCAGGGAPARGRQWCGGRLSAVTPVRGTSSSQRRPTSSHAVLLTFPNGTLFGPAASGRFTASLTDRLTPGGTERSRVLLSLDS